MAHGGLLILMRGSERRVRVSDMATELLKWASHLSLASVKLQLSVNSMPTCLKRQLGWNIPVKHTRQANDESARVCETLKTPPLKSDSPRIENLQGRMIKHPLADAHMHTLHTHTHTLHTHCTHFTHTPHTRHTLNTQLTHF